MRQERRELLGFEEPSPDVVLLQHRDVGPVAQLLSLDREAIHPLQDCELAVDLGVRGTVLLPASDEGPYVGGCDGRHAPGAEHRFQVQSDAPLEFTDRPAAVDLVLVLDVRRGFLERESPQLRVDRNAALDVALAQPEHPPSDGFLGRAGALTNRPPVLVVLQPPGRALADRAVRRRERPLVETSHQSSSSCSEPGLNA